MKTNKFKKSIVPVAMALLTGFAPASIAMADGYNVTGNLYDYWGNSVSGQGTSIVMIPRYGGVLFTPTVTYDTNHYTISNLQTGQYTGTVTNNNYTPTYLGFNIDNADVVFADTYLQPKTVNVVATITLPSNRPAQNVNVHVRNITDGSVVGSTTANFTDSTGVVTLQNVSFQDLQQRKYELDVIDDNYQADGVAHYTVSPEIGQFVSINQTTETYNITANLQLANSNQDRIEGSLVTTNNTPVPNVTLDVYTGQTGSFGITPTTTVVEAVYSDNYGVLHETSTSNLPQGIYDLHASSIDQGFYLPDQYTVSLYNSYYYTGMSSPMTSGQYIAVTGQVIDKNGNPVSGATIDAFDEWSDQLIPQSKPVVTDANGNYSISVPSWETVQVRAKHDGFRSIETGPRYFYNNPTHNTAPTLTMVAGQNPTIPNSPSIPVVTSPTNSGDQGATTNQGTGTVLIGNAPATNLGKDAITTTTNSDGTKAVSVDATKAVNAINQAASGTKVFTIDASGTGATTTSIPASVFTAAVAKAGSDASLLVQSDNGAIAIPVSLIQSVQGSTGSTASIQISIQPTSGNVLTSVNTASADNHISLVSKPVTFTITATSASGSKTVEDFGSTFVQRSMALGNVSIDPKATSVFMLNTDGSLVFVPSKFVKNADGSYSAVFTRTGNSTYVVGSKTAQFSDTIGHWAAATIQSLASKGVVSGESKTEFNPNGNITRAEFASMLVNALGLQDKAQNGQFNDVKGTDWFTRNVSIASSEGLVMGVNGLFKPNDSITRQEMASMIANALKFVNPSLLNNTNSLSSYADQDKVAKWAMNNLQAVVGNGIMSGEDTTHLAPLGTATRAEAATVLQNLLQKLGFLN